MQSDNPNRSVPLLQIDARGSMLVHQSYLDGKHVRAGNVDSVAKLLQRSVDNFAAIYARATGKPIATTMRWMSKETRFSALEALRVGLAHELVNADDVVLFRARDRWRKRVAEVGHRRKVD